MGTLSKEEKSKALAVAVKEGNIQALNNFKGRVRFATIDEVALLPAGEKGNSKKLASNVELAHIKGGIAYSHAIEKDLIEELPLLHLALSSKKPVEVTEWLLKNECPPWYKGSSGVSAIAYALSGSHSCEDGDLAKCINLMFGRIRGIALIRLTDDFNGTDFLEKLDSMLDGSNRENFRKLSCAQAIKEDDTNGLMHLKEHENYDFNGNMLSCNKPFLFPLSLAVQSYELQMSKQQINVVRFLFDNTFDFYLNLLDNECKSKLISEGVLGEGQVKRLDQVAGIPSFLLNNPRQEVIGRPALLCNIL